MKIARPLFAALLCAVAAASFATPVLAEDCTGFKWPLDTELAWLASSDDVAVKSEGKLASPPQKAVALSLQPAKSVKMPVAPGVKAQRIAADTFSGWFTIEGLKSGLYQISLSDNGWIDAAQNGELISSKGFSGRQECKAIHKSVRFEIGEGPLTVQISGAPKDVIRITVNEGK